MINARDSRGRTALHWASIRGDLKTTELLLDADPDVNAVDNSGSTPLLYAATSMAPLRMVELLILRKEDVNLADSRGSTPLHKAARNREDLAFLSSCAGWRKS